MKWILAIAILAVGVSCSSEHPQAFSAFVASPQTHAQTAYKPIAPNQSAAEPLFHPPIFKDLEKMKPSTYLDPITLFPVFMDIRINPYFAAPLITANTNSLIYVNFDQQQEKALKNFKIFTRVAADNNKLHVFYNHAELLKAVQLLYGVSNLTPMVNVRMRCGIVESSLLAIKALRKQALKVKAYNDAASWANCFASISTLSRQLCKLDYSSISIN